MSDTVWVAVIVSIGPTIAALGAWRSAGKANKAVNNRPAEAPTISDDVAAIRRDLTALDNRVTIIYSRFAELLDHLTDPKRRRR